MVNTDSTATATFPMADGLPVYAASPPSTAYPAPRAEVRIDFDGIAGGSCGALLPTGNVIDPIDGITTTMIDNGMPVVVMRAADLGITGRESPRRARRRTMPCERGSSRSGCRPAR